MPRVQPGGGRGRGGEVAVQCRWAPPGSEQQQDAAQCLAMPRRAAPRYAPLIRAGRATLATLLKAGRRLRLPSHAREPHSRTAAALQASSLAPAPVPRALLLCIRGGLVPEWAGGPTTATRPRAGCRRLDGTAGTAVTLPGVDSAQGRLPRVAAGSAKVTRPRRRDVTGHGPAWQGTGARSPGRVGSQARARPSSRHS